MKTEAERAREAQQLVNAYHRTFRTKEGQEVLADLISFFNFNGPVFVPIKASAECFAYCPLTAAKVDGARSVIIRINEKLSRPVDGDSDAKPKPKVRKK